MEALFDHSVTGDTGESGLLIVSLRPGYIQVGMIHRRGEQRRVHRSGNCTRVL